jgi:valyl-tRNA synthetase
MGLALSYKNETFTLDKNVKELVNETFKHLYDDGLIYQDYKLVN